MKAPEPTSTNLYEREIDGPFSALCGGGQDNDGNMESCISIADLGGGGYALGDTKPEGAGQQLRMSEGEITSFARAWIAKIDD
ncbi:DUF397 domain-containing protein [Streptomyces sp. NBC_01242]|uniref:DUF397 domain-containing protein n=1 Tax=Streptomyces sp. NBC_01242 TaxID=2903795 RepID=UPI00225086E5|nr:DUF397 domain-containing protein [Streptomyces sp. NBC_01242]MCX4799658.1 DUF397 domain-containing protein [Streptomyces sp. NBC_01242]